jgi:HK97 family phage portal protein
MAISSAGDPWSIPSNGALSAYSSTGMPVDENTALQLLSVTACVRILSETVSGLPLDAVLTTGGTRKPVKSAPNIVTDPFGGANRLSGWGSTRKIGIAQMMVSLLLRGNAYAAVVSRDRDGMPDMLQVLSPDAVDVDVDRKTAERLYKVNRQPFPASDLMHIPGMMLPGQPAGLSVIGYAARTIGLGIAAEEFGSKFFGDGAHLSGIIEVPGDLKPDVARQMKESFESKHSGMNNAHAVGVLTAGAKFAPVSVSPEDAQFLGTRAAQTTDIAMLFGIPPHMLGQVDRTTSWGKGIEEQTLGFLKYTLSGWVNRFEDAFSALLPQPMQAWFNLDALLRPDTTARYNAYLAARNAAALTPNEIRHKEDMPPIEGGDDLFAPLNSAHTTEPDWQPGKPEVPADSPQGGSNDNAPAA